MFAAASFFAYFIHGKNIFPLLSHFTDNKNYVDVLCQRAMEERVKVNKFSTESWKKRKIWKWIFSFFRFKFIRNEFLLRRTCWTKVERNSNQFWRLKIISGNMLLMLKICYRRLNSLLWKSDKFYDFDPKFLSQHTHSLASSDSILKYENFTLDISQLCEKLINFC